MTPNEPFWRTNSSFSPALSRSLDYQFQSEGLQYTSNGDGIIAVYDSSLSSNSNDSRSWVNGEQVPEDRSSASDGAVSYSSSPFNRFQSQQLLPPPLQGVNIDDYVRKSLPERQIFSQSAEGNLRVLESAGYPSSQSDDSEHEHASKSRAPSHRSFSSCCSFMSKPIHPFSYQECTVETEDSDDAVAPSNFRITSHSHMKSSHALTEFQSLRSMDLGRNFRRDNTYSSSHSSMDSADVSGQLETEFLSLPHKNLNGGARCGLCERFLFQRSPWSSRRIVWSGDMPTTGVLSCWHVYHVECLERIIPSSQKHDPVCPLCEKLENDNGVEQWAICRLKNGLPRLKSVGEEGPSRVWSSGQAVDCAEGAIDVPKRSSSMLLRNRGRRKRQLSIKGNSSKERAESSKRSGLCSPRVSIGAVGCSTLVPGSVLKRW